MPPPSDLPPGGALFGRVKQVMIPDTTAFLPEPTHMYPAAFFIVLAGFAIGALVTGYRRIRGKRPPGELPHA